MDNIRKKAKFEKLSRVVWILASVDGCVLAHGHLDPTMPPYHLNPLTDRIPAIVHAPNKVTLDDAKRAWNSRARKEWPKLLVHERKVRITIEEV